MATETVFKASQDEHFANIMRCACLVMNTLVDQNKGLFDASMFQVFKPAILSSSS